MRKLLPAALLLAVALHASAQAPPPPPEDAATPTEGAASEWPKAIVIGTGTLELFQPQLEKFEGVTLSGRSAVSWTEKDKAPVFGVVWYTTTVTVDRDARLATVETIKVDKVRFPNITKEEERQLATVLETEVPKWDLTVGLDAIQASLAVSQAEKKSSEGLRSTPPRMLFSNQPAVLLLYTGKPVEQPIQGTSLKRAVNTPMFVVQDPATRRWYLSGGKFWYEAQAALGPFTPVAAPSPAVKQFHDAHPPPAPKLEGDAAQQDAEKAFEEPASPPAVIVSTDPAELFVFDGPPKYVPVGDSADLLYAENTQRDVLVHVPTSETFVLASGRWFKAKSQKGPWTFVRPDQLPASFAKLPPDSPVGQVRTFVSGTDEALDAVADSQIPQTTAVKRDQQFQVTYDGEPRFKAIEGTPLAFAVNTPTSVIQDAGRYWACEQAVWYVAPTPKGPWTVSDRRPPDIDQVPPSAPVYNTRYVYVYQSTPEVVYVGYTPGYVGMYPYYGTVVYGTGFYYPPYIGPSVYYPRPMTYGFNVIYNPWVGFGFGFGYGSPFFYSGMRFGPSYYGPGWWGPPGYRPFPPPYPGGWYRPPPGYRPPYPGWGYRPPPPGYRPPPAGYPRRWRSPSPSPSARRRRMEQQHLRSPGEPGPQRRQGPGHLQPARAPPDEPPQQRLRGQEGERLPAEPGRVLGSKHAPGMEAPGRDLDQADPPLHGPAAPDATVGAAVPDAPGRPLATGRPPGCPAVVPVRSRRAGTRRGGAAANHLPAVPFCGPATLTRRRRRRQREPWRRRRPGALVEAQQHGEHGPVGLAEVEGREPAGLRPFHGGRAHEARLAAGLERAGEERQLDLQVRVAMGRAREQPAHRHRAVELLADLANQGLGLSLAGLDLAPGELPLAATLGVAVAPRDEDAAVPAEDRRDHPHPLHFRSTAMSSPALDST